MPNIPASKPQFAPGQQPAVILDPAQRSAAPVMPQGHAADILKEAMANLLKGKPENVQRQLKTIEDEIYTCKVCFHHEGYLLECYSPLTNIADYDSVTTGCA